MICEKYYLHQGREDVSLTTYVLEDSPEMMAGKKRGAVLVCPGGAYLNCSDREGEPVAMAFAAMGYHAFVLRYSVYFEGRPGFDLAGVQQVRPHSVFPHPMQDIGRAMLFIRERAEEWQVDMDKVAVCGFSAGAHNCAMYSVYWDKPLVAGALGVDAVLLKPAACILGYTLSDYIFMKGKAAGDAMAQAMFRASNMAFLGSAEGDEALLQAVSPARLVDKSTPPMFLWATSADNLVPVQHTTLLATALAEQGIPFELHVYEEGGHGLSVATAASAGAMSEIDGDAAGWVGLCAAWLNKRMLPHLPKRSPWEQVMQAD